MTVIALYADGGVIHRNPSPIGGTWAFCLVNEHGERVYEESGVIEPTPDLPLITNNVTELYAIVKGLQSVSSDWIGTVYSDSWVSLQRVFLAAALNNVPAWLVNDLQILQRSKRLAHLGYCLLDGHPTKAQLLAGKGKRGNFVSEHNVWCDKACQEQARQFQALQPI